MRRKSFVLPTREQQVRQRENVTRANKKCRTRNISFVNMLKRRPCLDCSRIFPPYVMDFDHVRGVKTSGIAQLAAKSVSIEVILAEITKCDLVCANCHRERTHQRKVRVPGAELGLQVQSVEER